jgi:hypothetical protein
MGTTANLGLPYPENTDPLANMAAAVQALASAVDAASGDPWQAWVPNFTNLTIGNAKVTARYRLTGKTALIRVAIVAGSTTAATGAVSMSLPFAAAGLSTNGEHQQIPGLCINPTTQLALLVVTAGGNSGSWYAGTAAAAVSTFSNGHIFRVQGALEVA